MITLPRLFPIVAVIVLAGCFLAGCAAKPSRQVASTNKAVAALTARATGEVPFLRAWELQLPTPVECSWISPNAPELVFFQCADSHAIHCVEVRSGQTRWVTSPMAKQILGDAFVQRLRLLGERQNSSYIRDRLYFICDDTLVCLDVATGQQVWHYDLPFAASTGPLVAGENDGSLRVFIGDWNNHIQVATLESSKVVEQQEQKQFPRIVWQMGVASVIRATGLEHEGLCYFGDHEGNLLCFPLERELKWSVPTGGAIDGGATVRDRSLYVGNDGNALHALNRLTGERLGQFNLTGAVKQRPFWFANEKQRLYVWVTGQTPGSTGLVALRVQPDNVPYTDPKRNPVEVVRMGQDWFLPGATRLVSSTPLHLIVSDDNNSVLWAAHRGTGKVAWVWSLNLGWPGNDDGRSGALVDHVLTYQDRSDALRTVIASDNRGFVAAFTMFDYVPSLEQEASGITSRSIASDPKAAKPVAAPAAK
ncbi:MAG: PQQ-binding-like beta-propeller repeat protein [Planctomycetota bacterium]